MAKSTGFYDGQNFTVTGSYFKGQEVHTYTRNYTFRVLTIDETLDIYTQDWNMPKERAETLKDLIEKNAPDGYRWVAYTFVDNGSDSTPIIHAAIIEYVDGHNLCHGAIHYCNRRRI